MKTPLKKSSKISTTVRFDSDLKRRAEAYARANHMDFTSFLHFSVQTTMKHGGKVEPEMSDERYKYYSELVDRVDAGLEKTYGPFE
jgi:hypothetical protein